MKFVRQSFMGIELDILTGHPEHDILFIATQVARAAGLKNPSVSVCKYRQAANAGFHAQELHQKCISVEPSTIPSGFRKDAVLFTEPETYQMLLRGHAPQSEPFRKWVTEVVLPSIRKTGKFDVNEAQDAVSQQYAGELAALHAEVIGLKAQVAEMFDYLRSRTTRKAVPSPYEGQVPVTIWEPAGFDKRLYRELAEAVLSRPSADKMEPRVVLRMEIELGKVVKCLPKVDIYTPKTAQFRGW